MAPDNHPLKTQAVQLQSLISCAEFTGGQEQSIPYADGFQSSLELLKEARERKAGVFLVGNGGTQFVAINTASQPLLTKMQAIQRTRNPTDRTMIKRYQKMTTAQSQKDQRKKNQNAHSPGG